MATGRQAFSGTTISAIHDAFLSQAPAPITSLNPDLPPILEEIIRRALEKDRELRYHSAGDLRTQLKRLKRETDSAPGTAVSAVVVEASRPSEALQEHELDARATGRALAHRYRFAAGAAAVIVVGILAFLFRRHAAATANHRLHASYEGWP
jgi:hypothetical protein